jgi:hypothetical protein
LETEILKASLMHAVPGSAVAATSQWLPSYPAPKRMGDCRPSSPRIAGR